MCTDRSWFRWRRCLVVFFIGVAWAGSGVFAAEVSVETAGQVAINHMNSFLMESMDSQGQQPKLLGHQDIAEVFVESYRGEVAYYVFNLTPQGWVAVGADNVATPILAYSERGFYIEDQHPPAFDVWMNGLAEKVHLAKEAHLTPSEETAQEWSLLELPTESYLVEYGLTREKSAPSGVRSAFYLLWTAWAQGWTVPALPIDFNMYCPCVTPLPLGGCWERTPTGCVATAMAQIMMYWQWPLQGTGSHCYDDDDFGEQCAEFGNTSYDWLTMGLFPWTATEPTGVLMRHCGVSVDMDYGQGESGTQISYAVKAWAKYFNYDCGRHIQRISYTDSQWLGLITDELDAGQPVLYAAVDAGTGGHAFVCDGHDDADRLHMNWGWGPIAQALFNGYYTLDLHLISIDPIIDIHYQWRHQAVIKLHPIYLPPQVGSGGDVTILSEDQEVAELCGLAFDPDGGLRYQWFQGEEPLGPPLVGPYQDEWPPVPNDGIACLHLMNDVPVYPYFDAGAFELTFKARDCANTFPRDMTLTVLNSPPHPEATGAGTYEVSTPVTIGGSVWDFDGDVITYTWSEGATVLFSGTVGTPGLDVPADLPDHVISDLPVGTHFLTLDADDGVNGPVSDSITVVIVDITPPVVELSVEPSNLWPPNHKMVEVQVLALVTDNSQTACALTAVVTSNEPPNGTGDGDQWPDWTEPVIDQATGVISLGLRAERSGLGVGRVYTIWVTATDPSGNATEESIDVITSKSPKRFWVLNAEVTDA